MSYRKHLMPSNISPSAAYEATAVDSDTDTISRKAVTDAIEKCHKQCCREDATGDEWIHYEPTLNEVESIPPAQSAIVPCDYAKACNEVSMNRITSAVVYMEVLEDLREYGYVLVDMRGRRNEQ